MIAVPDAALLPSVRAADAALERVHDSGGKPVGKHRKRPIEHEARQSPNGR